MKERWEREDIGEAEVHFKYNLVCRCLGARGSAATMMELEKKTGIVIIKLYKIMRESRLAVKLNLESFRVRKSSIRVLRFSVQSGEF